MNGKSNNFIFLTIVKKKKKKSYKTLDFFFKMKYIYIYLYKIEFYSSLILVYMCVKLLPRDLNPGPYPPHSTSTYTCKVIIAPKMCGNKMNIFLRVKFWSSVLMHWMRHESDTWSFLDTCSICFDITLY